MLTLALRKVQKKWENAAPQTDLGNPLARVDTGHVTRERISQIINLLCLAPTIQEELLFLPNTEQGRDPIILAQLQSIAAVLDWRKQVRAWQMIRKG
jgi:hypothetical protein